MTERKGHGSDAARTANARAGREGKSNPRTSSAAQAELGRKGGAAHAGKGSSKGSRAGSKAGGKTS